MNNNLTGNPLFAGQTNSSSDVAQNTNHVGCRPWSRLVIIRYMIFAIGIFIAIILFATAPGYSCPSNSHETDACKATDSNYPCQDGDICYTKTKPIGGIIAGIVFLLVSIIFCVVSGLHQARYIMKERNFDDKVYLCC